VFTKIRPGSIFMTAINVCGLSLFNPVDYYEWLYRSVSVEVLYIRYINIGITSRQIPSGVGREKRVPDDTRLTLASLTFIALVIHARQLFRLLQIRHDQFDRGK